MNRNAERIRNEVRDEALEGERRRKLAGQFSGSVNGQPMPRKDLGIQEQLIASDRSWLKNGIYVNWPRTWTRLCDRAAEAGKRPIPFLVGIIEEYLGDDDGHA